MAKPKAVEAPNLSDVKEATQADFKPALKEDKKIDSCAWCNFEDEEIGKEKSKSVLVKVQSGKFQCQTCGKIWEEKALGKPYSLALERGDMWAREMRARELKES